MMTCLKITESQNGQIYPEDTFSNGAAQMLLFEQYLSPYLTGLRLFCDSWRQTSRVGRKAVLKQSPVIRNFLACVAKWRKVVAKILNMFKNFMRQNSSQNSRKVSKPSRTCRRPLAI